jgi:hypothetical protein
VDASSTSSSPPSNDAEQDPAYKYSDGVNQFLGNFLPSNKAAREELNVDFSAAKLTGISIQELAKLVEQGLSKTQWFVTGEVDVRLFADNFAFKDESVATTGIKAYATGVRKLFDQVGGHVPCQGIANRCCCELVVLLVARVASTCQQAQPSTNAPPAAVSLCRHAACCCQASADYSSYATNTCAVHPHDS